jgi:hypothetical protein
VLLKKVIEKAALLQMTKRFKIVCSHFIFGPFWKLSQMQPKQNKTNIISIQGSSQDLFWRTANMSSLR